MVTDPLFTQDKHFQTSDGIGLHYRVTKASPRRKDKTLIFLHGLGGELAAWDIEVDSLSKAGFNSIALDLRGHGLSGHPHGIEKYALERFARDVVELISYERLENPGLIGHCFGGMVAITLEALFPAASELVLVDTSFKPPVWGQMAAHHQLLRAIFDMIVRRAPDIGLKSEIDFSQFVGTGDYDLRRIFSDIMHTSLRSYLAILDQMITYDASGLLGRIDVPTLVVEGADDTIFPPQVARDLASRIHNAELDIIPQANHILVINNPEDLAGEILRFVSRGI